MIRTTKDSLKESFKKPSISEFKNLVGKLKMVMITAENKIGFLTKYPTTLIKKSEMEIETNR